MRLRTADDYFGFCATQSDETLEAAARDPSRDPRAEGSNSNSDLANTGGRRVLNPKVGC